MKKIISLFICLCMLTLLCSCGSKTDKSTQKDKVKDTDTKDHTITVLYSKTDNFDPFTAKTPENRQLCSLLFDPLFNLRSDFVAEPCIAYSAEVVGNICTVRLKNIYFSDGSPLTSEDVIYSFNLAKNSVTSGYSTLLAEFLSAEATDAKTVVFTASYCDRYMLNLLTFPIVKSGTAGLTDSDGVEIPPIGSGKYIKAPETEFFARNENYFGTKGSIKTINLLAAPDAESISHYVEVGAADLYYTDATAGKIVRMSGKRTEVNLNRLVYIGVNSGYGALAQKEMRYAISSAINRKEISSSAYYNTCTPASSFYNPSFVDVLSTASLEEKTNEEITVENLRKMGYNVKDEAGYYINSSGHRASFSLMVNSDNVSRLQAARLIAAQCKAVGIEITVAEESFDNYLARLKSGSFQLYLGEVQVMPNMDMGQLSSTGGIAAFGVNETKTSDNHLTVSEAIISYKSGAIGISDLSGVLITEMPQIPILYRNGLLFYGSNIKQGVEALYNNIYYSIENYVF